VRLNTFIASRYLFSKKSTNAINLISAISVTGTMVGTMALVIILSVFNGLEDLIETRYNAFDADYKILPTEGKTFPFDSTLLKTVKTLDYIQAIEPILEENALVKYGENYHPAHLKGVPLDYRSFNGLDTMLTKGSYLLQLKERPAAIVGQEIANMLSVNIDYITPLKIYVPRRIKHISMDPQKAFKSAFAYPSATFSIEQDLDNYVILPFYFVEQLLGYHHQVTSLEINTKKNVSSSKIKHDLTKILGHPVVVKNRFQQHAFVYKIMQSEKVVVFLILTLILLIASFNIIGSLSMLIIEKEKDIFTFFALGFSRQRIQTIFLSEGMLITFIGAFLGIVFGVLVSWLQQTFGFVKLQGSSSDAFIVQAYPVAIHFLDIVVVFITVILIGYLASRYPVRFIVRKKIRNNEID